VNATTLVRPSSGYAGVPADRRRAALALAWVEGIRLLRHPITVAAVLFLVGIWVSGWITNEANRYPVLQDVDRETGLGMMLLLGGAALIAGNLAVLRPHRTGTAALGDVLVLPYPLRTAAHLLALLPLGLLAAVLAVGRVAVLAVAPAAGRPNPYELATGPATVLLLGAVGVLLGRLTRSAIVAPLALLGLLATLIAIPLLWPSPTASARWFQPVVVEGDAAFLLPTPVHLMARPTGPHLAYLIGLIGLVAVAALARGGARTVRTASAGATALAVALIGGVLQAAPPSRSVLDARVAAEQRPSSQQTCQTLGQVTYCAFPDFTRWIPGWDAQVRGVLRRVPAPQAQQPIAVRQRLVLQGQDSPLIAAWVADDVAAGTPNAVTVDTRWGDSRSAVRLAGFVAYRVVTGERPGISPLCGARRVTVAWLAGQASAASHTGLRLLAAEQDRNGEFGVFLREAASGFGVLVPHRELAMALALLNRPADEVGARVLTAWDELAAPGTTTERAGEILGVPVPSAPPPGADAPQDSRGECP
jgi:hypothetical protein